MTKTIFSWIAAGCFILFAGPLFAQTEVKIGILNANQSQQALQLQWDHLATAMTVAMPEYHFVIEIYERAALYEAVASRQVDFIFTSPAHYLLMFKHSGLSAPLATLSDIEQGKPLKAFGGVIFTRADLTDIHRLEDVRGKSVAITSPDAFGGYQMQAYELSQVGINMQKDVQLVVTGPPHSKVLDAVFARRADIGFVRTGILERLADEGKLDLAKITIINQQKLPDFPVRVSTRLYPDWPVAALPQTSNQLKRKVAAFLLTIDERSALAHKLNIQGFDVPSNYTPVEDMLHELHLPPFDAVAIFSVTDVWHRYRWLIVTALTSVVIILLLGLYTLFVNRRLKDRSQALDVMNRQLHEEIVTRQQKELELHKFKSIIDSTDDAIISKSLTGIIESWNYGAEKLFGYAAQEALGCSIQMLIPTEYLGEESEIMARVSRGESVEQYEIVRRHREGRLIQVSITVSPILDDQGKVIGASQIFRDITKRKQAESDLRIAATAFETRESLMITDANHVIIRVNQAFTDDTGYTAEEVLGQSPSMLKSGRHDAEFYKVMWALVRSTGKWQGEVWDKRKNGEIYPKWLTISSVKGPDGIITHYVGSHTDITEKKQSYELIWQQANFDKLTGLANRSMFHDRMNMEISRASRANSSIALLFIDLDNFKEVNDTLGHDVGDTLLQEAARRISACVRESDLVSRLGGDEFTVIIPELSGTGHIEELAQKLINQLSAPYYIGRETAYVSGSIGISLYPDDAANSDTLMKSADQAMYAAKGLGRNCFSYFMPDMQLESQTRMQLNNDLRQALEQQEFVLHYQPQVNLETGRVTGVEALVRWQHPNNGLVPPGVFIPLAESNGLILPLGEWVMVTACRQLKQWQDQGLKHIVMSINLSARQFRQASLLTDIPLLLEKTGLSPDSVEFEITESVAMDNSVENIQVLEALRAIGVELAIDDFGTGHSSLGYLKDFPITRLKLDRSFIINIETQPADAIIVSATIKLAHDLGLQVVAEGVEDEKQVEYLSRLNCDVIQGYYFSKPLPANQAEAFIREINTLSEVLCNAESSSINVLVIDDDELLCKFLVDVYTHLGHTVQFETDPVRGLARVQQAPEKYGLFLVDMLMPNMSGIDLIKGIRACCQEVPIVVITAYKFDHVRKSLKPVEVECRVFYGINFFMLEKPLSADDITDLTNKIFMHPDKALLSK